MSEKTNAHASGILGSISCVQFSQDGSKIVSCGITDKTIKVWDADLFNLLDSRAGVAFRKKAKGVAFRKKAKGVVRDGLTIHMKDGGGAFYAPSPISCVAVSWPRIAAGAWSGELYHLEVM